MELYFQSPKRLHGVVLSYAQIVLCLVNCGGNAEAVFQFTIVTCLSVTVDWLWIAEWIC
jgi:hypothetical protein